VLAAAALAAPKKADLEFIATAERAVEIARTRGKLILLTVLVDNSASNRAVVDQVFRSKEFRKIAGEFVLLYANKDDDHGKVRRKNKQGQDEERCADCPSLFCTQHMFLANSYARSFYPGATARTPIHFVLDAEENKVHEIKNGTHKDGFDPVPVARVVEEMKKLLKKHGRGLTEPQFKQMEAWLVDARAAKARKNTALELKALTKVVRLSKEVEGVKRAKERLRELEQAAAARLDLVDALIEKEQWEAALDAYDVVMRDYPGTLSAASAKKARAKFAKRKEVKRILKAKKLYEAAMKLKNAGKADRARTRLEKCARVYGDTSYGKKALAALGSGSGSGG